MGRFGRMAGSAALFLGLSDCDSRTVPQRVLDEYWRAYAGVNIAFERLKETDPARAAQLRAICAQSAPPHYDDMRDCIAEKWTEPSPSGTTQLTRAEAEYVQARSDFSHVLTPLLQTDPAKAERLRTLCEAEMGPQHMHNCLAERWTG